MAQLLEEFAPLPSETLTPAALGLINRPVAIDAAEDLEFTMNVVSRNSKEPVYALVHVARLANGPCS